MAADDPTARPAPVDDRPTADDVVVDLDRDTVLVTGPEAAAFLQGQLSQDVAALVPGGPRVWSLLLQPTGKADAWLGISRLEDEVFLLDVDAGFADVVEARLTRFKLRTKATIEVVAGWRCTAPLADLLDVRVAPPDPAAGAAAARPPSPDAVAAARIEQGIPAMGAEVTADTIPAELGQWLVDASVSFTKGCYTGQELVARIDSRGGHVPRHLRRLELGGPPPVPGATVEVDGRSVGTVTSSAPSGAGAVALAVVHRSVEPPAEATVVDGDDRRPARLVDAR